MIASTPILTLPTNERSHGVPRVQGCPFPESPCPLRSHGFRAVRTPACTRGTQRHSSSFSRALSSDRTRPARASPCTVHARAHAWAMRGDEGRAGRETCHHLPMIEAAPLETPAVRWNLSALFSGGGRPTHRSRMDRRREGASKRSSGRTGGRVADLSTEELEAAIAEFGNDHRPCRQAHRIREPASRGGLRQPGGSGRSTRPSRSGRARWG